MLQRCNATSLHTALVSHMFCVCGKMVNRSSGDGICGYRNGRLATPKFTSCSIFTTYTFPSIDNNARSPSRESHTSYRPCYREHRHHNDNAADGDDNDKQWRCGTSFG